ncbi:MAG: 8-amino-7-oxononanoate synthase [Nitrospirae bacterium]|nr:8-amino-7-oxononanoate synthase [Nitrospirota bacterium]
MLNRCCAALAHAESLQRLRTLRPVVTGAGARLTIEGRSLVNLGSNNYLGLAEHPRVKAAASAAIERDGVGAGASRLLTGHRSDHEDLEAAIARLKGTEAALVFSSGYLANIGVIPALMGRGDVIFADRDDHASLIEGCRASGARLRVYRRDRLDRLQTLLAQRPRSGAVLIVTESVFSMEGDLAPLPDLVDLAERHGASVMVDDAHATGVLGTRGSGSSEHWNLQDRPIIQMGTLSKALGALGGFVAGPKILIDHLVNRAKSFIYTTALPAAIAAAAFEAIRIVEDDPEPRRRLWANRLFWHDGVRGLGFDTFNSASPIIPIRIGSDALAVEMASALAAEGVYAPVIRPPTVPAGSARIRTSILATHTVEDLVLALAAVERVGKRLGLA